MSDQLLKLTADELERYAPYHLNVYFGMGFDDYHLCIDRSPSADSVDGQAYDRGMECAMMRGRSRLQEWKKEQLAWAKNPGY